MREAAGQKMQVVFIAADPGGYDVVWPVYCNISGYDRFETELLLYGVSADRHPQYAGSRDGIFARLNVRIRDGVDFLLVTGTSWPADIEPAAIRLCKNHGITTVSILDYWGNYKERFLIGSGYVFPDYYFVMDEIAVKGCTAHGIDDSILTIVGQPGLDRYVQKRVEPADNNKILFLSQPLSVLYGDSLGYTEFTVFEDLLRAGKELDLEVYLKCHPRESSVMKEKYRGYMIDGGLEEIIGKYSLVVGMNTIALLQCLLMGFPVVSYEPHPAAGAGYCITNALGITEGAYSYVELIDRLKTGGSLKNAPLPFWFDGKSTDRCTEEIIKISNWR